MPRFFVTKEQIDGQTVTICGEDAHHISRSLRMATGETVTVCDEDAIEYLCELTDFLPDRVLSKVLSKKRSESEPPYFASVFQALPKGDKLDTVIQKSVECGASAILTFESSRCIVKDPDPQKKMERRRKIALEAAKQCGRAILPTVDTAGAFRNALQLAAKADLALFCYEGSGTESLRSVLEANRERLFAGNCRPTVSVMIGSEGGFSEEESEMAKTAGLIPVCLGNRILRTETASAFVLSCLVYAFDLPSLSKDDEK